MKRWWAVLALAIAPAVAEDLACGKQDAVDCFVSQAKSKRSHCDTENYILGLKIETARMKGAITPSSEHLKLDQCMRDAQDALKPYFDAAKANAKPDVAAALTDYFVDTIAFMKNNVPQIDETNARRRRRMETQEQGLTKLETRIGVLK